MSRKTITQGGQVALTADELGNVGLVFGAVQQVAATTFFAIELEAEQAIETNWLPPR